MDSRLRAALICLPPTLIHGVAAVLSYRYAGLVLDTSIGGFPLAWPVVLIFFFATVGVLAASFMNLAPRWLSVPAFLLNGAFLIMMHGGLHAHAGLICTGPLCFEKEHVSAGDPFLTARLGAPPPTPTPCDNTAVGRHAGECVAIVDDPESAIYFSAITFTTLGYGDLVPTPRMRLIAAIESVFGYFFLGLIVGVWIDYHGRKTTAQPVRPSKVAGELGGVLETLRKKLDREP